MSSLFIRAKKIKTKERAEKQQAHLCDDALLHSPRRGLPLRCDGVHLVHEHDARSVFDRRPKQLPNLAVHQQEMLILFMLPLLWLTPRSPCSMKLEERIAHSCTGAGTTTMNQKRSLITPSSRRSSPPRRPQSERRLKCHSPKSSPTTLDGRFTAYLPDRHVMIHHGRTMTIQTTVSPTSLPFALILRTCR